MLRRCLGMIVGLAGWAGAASAAPCELRLAYNSEPAPPYLLGDEGAVRQHPGAAVELLQRVAAQHGCLLRLSRVPNVRVLMETQAGRHDGAFMYSYSAARALTLAYPMRDGQPDTARRITRLSYYLYRLRHAPVDWDGQKIQGLQGPVGVNFGWSIGKDLREQGIAVEEALNTQQNFDKLRHGRIAAFATQDLSGDAALRRYGYSEVERLPLPLSSKDYFLVFNLRFYQTHRELAERIWTSMASLRDSALPGLLQRYEDD